MTFCDRSRVRVAPLSWLARSSPPRSQRRSLRRSGAGAAITCRLLTALDERPVLAGALDPGALGVLLQSGWEVRTIPNPARQARPGRSFLGLLGSGNLTAAELGSRRRSRRNVELGVILARSQSRRAAAVFDEWWYGPTRSGKPISHPYERLHREATQNRRRLPVLGKPLPIATGGVLDCLAGRSRRGQTWVKAMYHRPHHDAPDWWRTRGFINDRHLERDGRLLRRPSCEIDDVVALYLVEPAAVPILHGVVGTAELRNDLVRRIDGPEAAERCGWLTPVEVLGCVSLDQAPTLGDFELDARSLRNGRMLVTDPRVARRIRQRLDRRTA